MLKTYLFLIRMIKIKVLSLGYQFLKYILKQLRKVYAF